MVCTSTGFKRQIMRFIFSFIVLFMVYSICLNHSFTSDQVGAWNTSHGRVGISGIVSTLPGGRFMNSALSVIGWMFSKVGVTVYENQYVFKLIIIAVAAFAVCVMYDLFNPYLEGKAKPIVILTILTVSFANPYYVETFVYTGFEWSVGLLLAVWSVILFWDRKYIRAAIVVFLAITTYQSYVVIFLVLTTALVFLEKEAKPVKSAWISYIRMLLVAGIPTAMDIIIVKISVSIMNYINAGSISTESAAQVAEVKPVVISTGIFQRIYMMCAAYYGATCTCFGMLPYGTVFVFMILLIAIIVVYMIRNKVRCNSILYFLIIAVMINIFPVAIYFVMGGESLGIVCRVVWPVFISLSMMILFALYLVRNRRWMKVIISLFGVFALVNVYCTQTTAMDFFIANKLDANEMNQIEAEIDRYETESGNIIEYIATAYTDDASQNDYSSLLNKNYKIWTFHRKTTHNSWSTVELLNYISGEEYIKIDMDQNVYDNNFAGKDWNEFIPEEQLVFDDDTMYWAIY